MSEICMLTTSDNPYNPFTHFDEWYKFDEEKGYCTCGYLSRIAKTSDELSEELNREELNNAMNEILKYDASDKYLKVTEQTADKFAAFVQKQLTEEQ